MAKLVVTPALMQEASAMDELLCSSWSNIKKHRVEFGRACTAVHDKELHKYIHKQGSKKGFPAFDEYIAARTNGEASHSFVWESMRIYGLTLPMPEHKGEPLPTVQEASQMPVTSALRMARLRKNRPMTKRLIEDAMKEPATKFAVEAQSAINEGLTAEEQKTPLMRWMRMLHPRLIEKLEEAIEDFKLLPVVKDRDLSLNLENKALWAIVNAAMTFAGDAIEAAKKQRDNETPVLPETQQAVAVEKADEAVLYSAPDAGQKIGIALDENRVVKRTSEALN